MTSKVLHLFGDLGIGIVVTFLIWQFYKARKFIADLRYSTFGPRFWSGPVDGCVMWPIRAIAFAALAMSVHTIVVAVVLILQELAQLLYTVAMHGLYGQTVGKMITQVRVVDYRTEGPISWRQAWLREGIAFVFGFAVLGWKVVHVVNGAMDPKLLLTDDPSKLGSGYGLLMSLPLLWFVVEVLTMLTNEKRRALHDLIAGTVVVRTNIEEPIAKHAAA